MKKRTTILYVDSEVNNHHTFTALFRRDYRVLLADTVAEGLDKLRKNRVHIIVSDQRVEDISGIQFLEETLKDHQECVRILVADYPGAYVGNRARLFGFISKPWDENQLSALFKRASELYFLLEILTLSFW